jgi:endoglucanase
MLPPVITETNNQHDNPIRMKTAKLLLNRLNFFSFAAFAALLLAGCQSAPQKSTSRPAAMDGTKPALPTIRIKTGVSEGFTDNSGNTWLPDQGFADGVPVERPDIAIEGATDQRIYRAERYSMTSFTQALPNGSYIVKLHFCETYDGITGPGQRVFSFNVAGHDFKDFDVWVKAGGALCAYVETVPVEITDGKLEITFTANVENPQINGIEIIPAH